MIPPSIKAEAEKAWEEIKVGFHSVSALREECFMAGFEACFTRLMQLSEGAFDERAMQQAWDAGINTAMDLARHQHALDMAALLKAKEERDFLRFSLDLANAETAKAKKDADYQARERALLAHKLYTNELYKAERDAPAKRADEYEGMAKTLSKRVAELEDQLDHEKCRTEHFEILSRSQLTELAAAKAEIEILSKENEALMRNECGCLEELTQAQQRIEELEASVEWWKRLPANGKELEIVQAREAKLLAALEKISRLGQTAGVPSKYHGKVAEYYLMLQQHAGAQAPQIACDALKDFKGGG